MVNEKDVERCIELLEKEGYNVIDFENGYDLYFIYKRILDWIDKSYNYEIELNNVDYWFVSELRKRIEKIDALSDRAISEGKPYYKVPKWYEPDPFDDEL